jgi:hypothetical protein
MNIDLNKLAAGLGGDKAQVTALLDLLAREHAEAFQAALNESAAAKSAAAKVVKPERAVSRGPTWFDTMLADPSVLAAFALHLKCDTDKVYETMVSRLERPSLTATLDRKDDKGVVHKVRIVLIDETAKSRSAIQGKIDDLLSAPADKLDAAVSAALAAVKGARSLPSAIRDACKVDVDKAIAAAKAKIAAPAPPPPPAP